MKKPAIPFAACRRHCGSTSSNSSWCRRRGPELNRRARAQTKQEEKPALQVHSRCTCPTERRSSRTGSWTPSPGYCWKQHGRLRLDTPITDSSAFKATLRMSNSSDNDHPRTTGVGNRVWEEPQPGPSRNTVDRQGYCGCCKVLYSNLDQHLSSLRHLDSVQTSCSESSSLSSRTRSTLTLLERFLQDVQQYHPHHYSDPRPSHTDLPLVSAPPLPKVEAEEVCFPADEGSFGNHSSHDASCQSANQKEWGRHSQSGKVEERLSLPDTEQEATATDRHGQSHRGAPPPESAAQPSAPLSVHRKAHRKTNRRKTSDSSTSPGPKRCPPSPPSLNLQLNTDLSAGVDPKERLPPVTESRPWLSWQRKRKETHKEAFSSDSSDPLQQTIEEVIQMCCYGISCSDYQQDEPESVHLSLPSSTTTRSEEWDLGMQGGAATSAGPGRQTEEQDFSHLMDVQVELEDHLYSQQLDSALLSLEGGPKPDEGFWTLPIEEVLPAPENIPESFRGKSWVQIEKDDEEKVNELVQQFRQGRFICYFDTESLARYGRRSQSTKKPDENGGVKPTEVLPLLEHDGDDITRVKRRRIFRPASRCQVVKVSHSTQTTPLIIPAVHPAPKVPPTTAITDNGAERTPNTQKWRRLPLCYSNVVTPVQLHTSLVYLLCSPLDSTPASAWGATPRRHRRRRHSPTGQTLKYKRLPVQVYEPRTNRILRKFPKSFLSYKGSASSAPAHPCVRQLFRSLSPDLNSDRPPGQLTTEDSFLQSTLSRECAQTVIVRRRRSMAPALGPPLASRAERYKDREQRTSPPPSKSRFRLQALPLQSRREGLRPACPGRRHPTTISHAPFGSHRGKGQRGRAYKRRGR